MTHFSKTLWAPIAGAALLLSAPVCAQTTSDPFPQPIERTEGVVLVGHDDFATLPDVGGEPARPMLLVAEPGSDRMFANDMRGPLYRLSADGRVTPYLNVDDGRWAIPVEASGRERGFQSFAVHPDFAREGAPGYGKIYAWTDTEDTGPTPDFRPGGGQDSHDTVLLEWTASDVSATRYDGGPPRTLLRIEQPFGNHNAGHIGFNPTAAAGDAEYGLLYVGVADGGSGGDPLNLSQNLGSVFGKILRIDPLGDDAANGQYGIPADNPFVGTSGRLGEIYAYGVRNPQRFGWDTANGAMYNADIGQNTVEELSPVVAGGNLGWNVWEGSFRYRGRQGVESSGTRGDPTAVFPVAEWAHPDGLMTGRAAATGVVAYRADRIPQLNGLLLFGDFPSGEVFYVSADDPPGGGQDPIRRVLFRSNGGSQTLLELVQAANRAQGRSAASRTDLRFGEGHDGRLFVLNKQDGIIREMTR